MARILSVDDEPMVSNILKSLLESHGNEVHATQNPMAALELLKTKNFDLVISDIRMAPMNGVEFLRHIRREHHDIPVIMLTAYASADTAKASKQLKAFAYLTKPFTNEVVLSTVERALKEFKARKAQAHEPKDTGR